MIKVIINIPQKPFSIKGRLSRWVIVNIPLLTLLMAAVCACHKESVVDLTDAQIVLSAVETGDTKALLDVTKFAKEGNQLHIYDYYTPKVGNPTYHIDDQVESQGSSIWPFVGQRYSWTPDGVHKFYGWMYKVNGWFPNYGCSSYTLKDGDTIVWCYTCNGLGEDVGAGSWQ
jgi:hypothetical protein